MKLSIIIPLYNEKDTIEQILNQVFQAETLGLEKEVVVVDDGSNQETKEILSRLSGQFNFIMAKHERNLGKGAAIRTGLNYAFGDLILFQDADLEYYPKDYKTLLAAFKQTGAVIYGSRNLEPRKRGYHLYCWGAAVLTWLVNQLYHINLTDVYTGYKLFPAKIIKGLELESRGFEIEAEITCKLLKKGLNIQEVPISYSPRTFSQGKKIRLKDWFIGLWTILKNRV